METYTIFYIYNGRAGIMHSHCLADSIDWLYDHGYTVIAIRDVATGKTYQCATNVRKVEDGE